MAVPDTLPAPDAPPPFPELPLPASLDAQDLPDARPPKGFKPKKLSTVSLDVPMQRRWDVMGTDEAKRLHAKAQAEAVRFSWTGPVTKKRALRYFVLTPLGFALIGCLFVSCSLSTIGVFLLVGVPLGGLVWWLRPDTYLCGALYALCGLAAILLSGHGSLLSIGFAMTIMGSIGKIVGTGEEFRRLDGED